MSSQKKSWHIRRVAKSAKKYLDRLDIEQHEKILIKIECLEYDPFMGDVRKVQGKDDIYRLRVDDYRIYYRVCLSDRSIDLLLINHKAAIKDRIIQRL